MIFIIGFESVYDGCVHFAAGNAYILNELITGAEFNIGTPNPEIIRVLVQ
jgi:hypothetical protein